MQWVLTRCPLRRFLRARHFDLKAATTMWENCQNWRKTVEGIGIDELYRRLDPYDVREYSLRNPCDTDSN